MKECEYVSTVYLFNKNLGMQSNLTSHQHGVLWVPAPWTQLYLHPSKVKIKSMESQICLSLSMTVNSLLNFAWCDLWCRKTWEDKIDATQFWESVRCYCKKRRKSKMQLNSFFPPYSLFLTKWAMEQHELFSLLLQVVRGLLQKSKPKNQCVVIPSSRRMKWGRDASLLYLMHCFPVVESCFPLPFTCFQHASNTRSGIPGIVGY